MQKEYHLKKKIKKSQVLQTLSSKKFLRSGKRKTRNNLKNTSVTIRLFPEMRSRHRTFSDVFVVGKNYNLSVLMAPLKINLLILKSGSLQSLKDARYAPS